MRLPRVLSAVVISAAMATPLVSTSRLWADAPADAGIKPAPKPAAPAPADAPPAPAPVAPPAPAPVAPVVPAPGAPASPDAPPALTPIPAANPLTMSVENFWHYAKIAKYDLASAEGQKILASGASAADILQAFQAVTSERKDELFDTLFKWLNVEPMKDVSEKLIAKLKEGQTGMFTDPKWIMDQVGRLSVNERAFEGALANLRNAGEFAAPIMIDVLRDPGKKAWHSQTRRGLVRLGRQVLNPLVAVLESKDHGTLITVMGILGEIGYDAASPYIARVYASKDNGMEEVKAAAARALTHLATDPQSKPADLFNDLAEKFYYMNAAIAPDPRYPDAHVWYWDETKGLMNKDVPPQIFSDIMSMRCSEYALKLDPSRADSVSLWLAANNKREAELPEGKTDATHEGPDAHFYNVALGTQYCNAVLSRALHDRSAPVALKVVKSLQEIVGQSNLFQGPANADDKQPIVSALQFPDRLVRFESAIAIGSAFPQQPFAGQELVVPTLAEAIGNTGKPNVVIVAPDVNAANAIKESLKDAVRADTGSDAQSATAAAGRLPSVDVLVVDSRGGKDTDAVLMSPRGKGVAKVVIVETKASPYVAAEMDNQLVNTLVAGAPGTAPDAAALTAAITKALGRAGSAAMDPKVSETYAQRAASLLEKLAISHGQVLDINAAAPALMRALEDPRVEIAKSSANVLAMINSKEAQAAIAAKALDEKTADDLKIATFKALAMSAKASGNQLDANTTDALQKAVETSANLPVKAAAAEAQGALNLPADRAKNLIINQSQVGK
ncbi:MAG: hypothetical protein JWN40_4779 [Phycisphaerales bacterium]|nr:hypothetical protein [Phycisphaerales bacterium]